MALGQTFCALPHNRTMQSTHDIKEHPLPSAWTELLANQDAAAAMSPQAYRLAFADPENRIGFAYVMNRMENGVLRETRPARLVQALYGMS